MKKREGPTSALWRFGDSPFTWGGVGVVIGSALASPVWFKYAFIAGGLAISIGLVRANFFNIRRTYLQLNIALLLCLTAIWYGLWKAIPKPVEPLTREDARQLLGKFYDQISDRENANRGAPRAAKLDGAEKPITRSEFMKLLQQYGVHPSQPTAPSPAPLPALKQGQAAPLQARAPDPEIASVPKSFTDGQINGKNFGAMPRFVYMRIRVKSAAREGRNYGPEGWAGDNLFGGLRGTNEFNLSSDIVKEWSDTAITLKFPTGYWQTLLDEIKTKAKERQLDIPQQSDLEVGYQLRNSDGDQTGWFYAK
jgi:hypothetical protein